LTPPYSYVENEQRHAEYKIYRDIAEGKPPAIRPDSLNHTKSKLWDHFESCWNTEAQRRPNAAQVLDFLEENGRGIAQPLLGDLNIPIFSHLREDPVMDITERLKVVSALPLSESGYSTIWLGSLDEDQLVSYLLSLQLPNQDIGLY
jgi:hypothetical protein